MNVMLRPTVSRPVCLDVKLHVGPETRFFLLSNRCGFVDVGVPYLTRGLVCRLQLQLSLASTVILGSESGRTCDRILLYQIRDYTNLEGQAPVFISPTNRVAQLYIRVLGCILIASYDSQAYSGSNRTLLHTRLLTNESVG
jgi:hypothetical protein